MKIVAIETDNFKGLSGYREFPDIPDGIIGIVGDNGKGKSTLMSAVAYAFYGPEVLDTGNADVVTWGEKNAGVNVWFMLDGSGYRLNRSTDGKNTRAVLEREGEPLAQSATEVTSVMTDLLGIDRVGFLASVFSRQEDLLGIGSLQPAKRQSTVLRLLQFDRIERALKNLSESNRDLNKEVSVLRMAGEPVKGVDPKDIKDYEDKLTQLIADRNDISTAVDVLASQVRKTESKIPQYNEYATKRSALEGGLNAAREEMTRARKEAEEDIPVAPTRPEEPIDVSQYEFRERELQEAVKAANQSICPTCNRPFDAEGTKAAHGRVQNLREWLGNHKLAYTATVKFIEAQERYDRAVERHKAAVERLEKSQSLVMDKMDALDALVPVENPLPAAVRAQEAFKAKDSELNRTNVLISSVETSLTHMRTALARQEEDAKRYAANQAEIKKVEHDIVVNGQTSLLMQQYKNNLIASVIPTITDRASSLITEMTEGKYTELALTPQYDIEYRNEAGDLKSFANLSGGEKDVFALALRLAIADLKAGSIGILVLDEVLESLDPGRQEATWTALERLTNRYNQVFVITHVDTFKDRAPHTIAV